MPKSKYLAIIDTLGHARIELEPGLPKLEYRLLCVGRGLPVEGYPAVPLDPAHSESLERPAVVTSAPLPWPDCYVHTLEAFTACISRLHKSPQNVVSISKQDLHAVLKYSVYDQYRHGQEKVAAYEAAQAARPAASQPAYPDDVDASPAHSVHSYSSSSASGSGSDSGRTASPFQPRRMDLHMEMWLDLNAGHKLSDPKLLTSELDQLESIEKDWAMRIAHEIVTKRPRTSAWLRGVDAAGDPETADVAPPVVAGGVGTEDIDIGPEDAIEHRIERAAKSLEGYPPAKSNPHYPKVRTSTTATWSAKASALRTRTWDLAQALASRVSMFLMSLAKGFAGGTRGRSPKPKKRPDNA
ncbi:hypothetical protein EXIGLDRAFT_736183 [Exidia glandulosa HHB12029]|uniref:Uncharacterized protein n=1 Tax=Exidia glandulosa HHB12029 TaxID=1314781 RepID=A0A165JK52_EXIGL|nr:hypothetical protein EXIGLDRAFT_736183 [Exidia glandulosa HHB12029]